MPRPLCLVGPGGEIGQMPRITEEHLREDLKERLAEAQDRLRQLSAESARLRRFVEGLRDVLGTINHEGPPASGTLPLEIPKPTLKTGTPIHAMSMKDGARTLLMRGPMTTRELLNALEEAGKRIGGKSPRDTLAATLRSYDQTFRRTADGTKWEVVPPSVLAEPEPDSEK